MEGFIFVIAPCSRSRIEADQESIPYSCAPYGIVPASSNNPHPGIQEVLGISTPRNQEGYFSGILLGCLSSGSLEFGNFVHLFIVRCMCRIDMQ